MGAADIVPGVSGGTVALVLGIYERLIHNIHTGAQALKALVTGDARGVRVEAPRGRVGVAVVAARPASWSRSPHCRRSSKTLLHDHPVRMAALFFGLVVGSLTIAGG